MPQLCRPPSAPRAHAASTVVNMAPPAMLRKAVRVFLLFVTVGMSSARAVCSHYLLQTKQARGNNVFRSLHPSFFYRQWQTLIRLNNLAWTTDFLELFLLKYVLVWVSQDHWKGCRCSHCSLCWLSQARKAPKGTGSALGHASTVSKGDAVLRD